MTKTVYVYEKTPTNKWNVYSIVTYLEPKSVWQTGDFKNFVCQCDSENEAKNWIKRFGGE